MVELPVLEVELGDCERSEEVEIDDDEEKVPDTEAAISCLAPHTFVLEIAAPTDDFK